MLTSRLYRLACVLILTHSLSAAKEFSRPVLFEPNRGQAAGNVAFIARTSNYTAIFDKMRPGFTLLDGKSRVSFRFSNSSVSAPHAGASTLSTSTYLLGNDPSKWRRAIENYSTIRYDNIYPGIDAVFYASGTQLEYDLLI